MSATELAPCLLCSTLGPKGQLCTMCNVPQSANAPQPAPKVGEAPATWELVIADMHERDQTGARKYGVRHQHDNGRDHQVDLYQELLDGAVYTRAEIERRKRLIASLQALRAMSALQCRSGFASSWSFIRAGYPETCLGREAHAFVHLHGYSAEFRQRIIDGEERCEHCAGNVAVTQILMSLGAK